VTCTQRQEKTLHGLDRIREAAKRDKKTRFTSLMHHITLDLLRESYAGLNRNAVPGVDKVTWREYGEDLEKRLGNLYERIHNGTYRAQPSKRIYIPKPDGKQRPIGIAALEDKIAEQAVVSILNQIYEEEFLGFSYGFRPGRSPHRALDAINVGITERKVNWILEVDIRSFFDNLDHGWLLKFLEHHIADSRILRLIRKWLRAGVSEEGQWSKTTKGTPQGSVISPLLANIYLHYVFDLWVNKWCQTEAKGEIVVVRYADDFVMGFQHKEEARRFQKELEERLATFELEINHDKTRLIEFGRFAEANRKERGEGKPETFDFLGFTHICSKNPKTGYFMIRRKTIGKRMRGKIKEVSQTLRRWMHEPVREQGKWLRSVVRGYFNYFAVRGNRSNLDSFRTEVNKAWFRTLRKRSQKARKLTWDIFKKHVKYWIPTAKVLHPEPWQRLRVST
jgi:group II intron reverse transcriptase/maturase